MVRRYNKKYYAVVYCDIEIDPLVLNRFPKFKEFKKQIHPSEIGRYLKMLNARPEIHAHVSAGCIRVVLSETVKLEKKGGVDELGIPLPDRKLNEICDIIREFSRIDPRKTIITVRRSLPLPDGMSPDVMRVDSLGRSVPRGSHALDMITDEEIQERRNHLEERNRLYEERKTKRENRVKNSLHKSSRKST